jgi:tetratricopeptide (TPR) repeat protein
METARQDYAKQLNDKSIEIAEYTALIEEYESDSENFENQIEIQERINIFQNAYGLLGEGRYQEAADAITDVSISGLPSNIVEIRETIINTTYPWLAGEYFNAGKTAYEADNDYDKALVDFEKCAKYIDSNSEDLPDLLFYLGSIYAMIPSRSKDAQSFLHNFLENYPNHTKVNEAGIILNELIGE